MITHSSHSNKSDAAKSSLRTIMFSRTLCALLLACSLFISSEAAMQSVTVPLLLGESENRIQGSSGSGAVIFTKTYTARAHTGVVTTAMSSNIVLTISPADQTIRFSDIVITNMPVDVTAAHIHGPCADAAPCSDGGVVYTICSPCPVTTGGTGGTITIPNFLVDPAQLNGGIVNFSTAFGLYQGIMYSNKLYYLNFHTAR
jgi:hypothetical protein